MRHTLLLAASAAAMMAGSAWAQEEPAPATEPAQEPAVTATEPAAEGATEGTTEGTTETQVVTTDGTDAPDENAVAAASPMQALTLAAERLQTVAQQMQTAGTGTTAGGTAGGTTDGTAGLGTTDGTTAGTTDGAVAGTTDGAGEVTTDDGVTVVTTTTGQGDTQMRQEATDALDQFDQAVQQVGGSPEGEAAGDQIAQIQQQSQLVRQQLEDEPQLAAEGMQELAQAALQIQTAQIPAEADRIIGKQLVTSDGEEAGQVTDVLITADGQVQALLIERGGALGLGGQQVAIQWNQVQIQGDQLLVNLPADQIEQMPEYQVD